MRTAGSYQAMDFVIYGKPAAEALRAEAERLSARRVYLIVSRTLNTSRAGAVPGSQMSYSE